MLSSRAISLVGRVFANGPEDWGSINLMPNPVFTYILNI